MAVSPELYESIIKIVDERIGDIKVTREEFSALREVVRELAEAQRRTEMRMEELAEAQRRTEMRMEELAEAQRRTEERLDGVAQQMQALVEAQRRTEMRMEELAEAQRRTEERLDGVAQQMQALAEAQRRTEEAQQRSEQRLNQLAEAQLKTAEALGLLTNEVRSLAQQVGYLSDNVGFGLEDVAKVVLPGYLFRHFRYVVDELNRTFFLVDKQQVEINLYGEGKHNGEEIVVLGECKARIYDGEVKKFVHQLKIIESQLDEMNKKVIKVMFGFYIHPSALAPAHVNDILLVASYQR